MSVKRISKLSEKTALGVKAVKKRTRKTPALMKLAKKTMKKNQGVFPINPYNREIEIPVKVIRMAKIKLAEIAPIELKLSVSSNIAFISMAQDLVYKSRDEWLNDQKKIIFGKIKTLVSLVLIFGLIAGQTFSVFGSEAHMIDVTATICKLPDCSTASLIPIAATISDPEPSPAPLISPLPDFSVDLSPLPSPAPEELLPSPEATLGVSPLSSLVLSPSPSSEMTPEPTPTPSLTPESSSLPTPESSLMPQ